MHTFSHLISGSLSQTREILNNKADTIKPERTSKWAQRASIPWLTGYEPVTLPS